MGNNWLNKLSLWTNDFDYVIAYTLEEAKTYAGRMMFGQHEPEPLKRYLEQEESDMKWYELDKNSIFRYTGGCDGSVEEKTVQEFIDIFGPGYFACSEW